MATNTNFNLMVNATVDTKQAEQQIANFTKKREIVTVVKIEDKSTNQIETRIQKVNTLVDNYGKTVKKVEQYDLMGNLKDSKIKSVSDSFKSLNTQTTKYKDSLGNVITEIKNFDEYGNSMTKQIKEYVDAQGYAVKETRNFDATGQQVGETIRNLSKDLTQSADSANSFSDNSQNMANSLSLLGDQFTMVNIKARLIQDTISGLKQAFSYAIQTVKEFDDALVEFKKVSDLQGESLQRYVDNLGQLGSLTGSTVTSMVQAATEFKKSSFNDEDSAKLASIAEMYRNIADEGITAGESASFIISQMKAFNIEADNAMHIIDAVNEVSNNFAVSSTDLTNSLGKGSSALKVVGVEFEEQLG